MKIPLAGYTCAPADAYTLRLVVSVWSYIEDIPDQGFSQSARHAPPDLFFSTIVLLFRRLMN